MSHNVNSMMYYGEKPWHKLGTEVKSAQTSEQAIIAAGLDWKVEKERLARPGGEQVDAYATVRDDNKKTLGVVGPVYTALQNRDAFKFFDAVVGEKAAMYHTAGALGDGEIVWMLAKLPGEIRVIGDDISEKYLLLTNRHDGRGAVQVMFTPIRVVCQNTLNIALGDAAKRFKLRHDGQLGTKVKNVQEYLGLVTMKEQIFLEAAKAMTQVQMGTQAFEGFVKRIGLVSGEDEKGRLTTRAQNIMDEVSRLFEHGRGNDIPGVKGTAWGAFNSVVEYVDYGRTTRFDKKAESLLLGSGARIKQAAWNGALEFVK